MKVEFVQTRPEHVVHLCENLRARDAFADEKMVMQELAKSFISYTGIADGQVAAIWGANTLGVYSDTAYIWLIGTPMIEQYPITFLRQSRRAIAELRIYFRMLYGVVMEDYECSVRWLKWLGFETATMTPGMLTFKG